MNTELKQNLIDALSTLSVYNPNSTRTQHVVRCPFCGDSHDPSHGHFSIKIDVNNDEPILYRCFKCDESGILTSETIDELGLSIDEFTLKELKSYNRKISKKHNLYDNSYNKLYVPIGDSSLLSNLKLEYLNGRLGTNMDFNTAKEYKVITDIFQFMAFNNIKSMDNATMNQLKYLNNNYIGFLSTNNNCITFRNITNNKNMKRYYKLVIDNHNMNKNTFYSIPNSFALMYTNKVNVHIGEGIMDILSVKENVVHETENNYYFASCGYGYITILKYLIAQGINTGVSLYIYSDNDKTDNDHMKYLFRNKSSYVTPWIDHITIRRNGYPGEKDYGVPESRIKKIERVLK